MARGACGRAHAARGSSSALALCFLAGGIGCVLAQPLTWQLVADTSAGDAGCDPAGITSTVEVSTLDACEGLCMDEIDDCARIELSKLVHFIASGVDGRYASRNDAEAACQAAGYSRLCTQAELEGGYDAAELLPPVVAETHTVSTMSAADGTDFGAAGGHANFSNGWVEFPGPPGTGGGERNGHVAYAFSCAAPSTVAWKVSAVTPDGKSDSLYVQVDSSSDEGWSEWHLGTSPGQSVPDFHWKSTASASFSVGAGLHTLLIREREVRSPCAPPGLPAAAELTCLCCLGYARRMASSLTGSDSRWEGASVGSTTSRPQAASRAGRPTGSGFGRADTLDDVGVPGTTETRRSWTEARTAAARAATFSAVARSAGR